MEYRNIGTTGLKVAPICVGTAFRGHGKNPNNEMICSSVIERAIEKGLNFFDCANVYLSGKSEEILGKVLKGIGDKRDDLVVTTKVGSPVGSDPNDIGLSRRHIMREIDRSLKRLQLDYVDIYLLHKFDPDTAMEETFLAMNDLVRQNKIRYIGICNFSAAQVVEALWTCDRLGLNVPVILQHHYSLLHRWEVEPELLPRCKQHGLGMMTYSALGVGLLSGQFRKGQPPPSGTLWASNEARFEKVMTDQIDRIVQALGHL